MSSIEWTDVTWNPTVGCRRVSPGCQNCYAERIAHRGMSQQHKGLTVMGADGPRWTGEVRLVPGSLSKPLHWRKPRMVFVDSMSDLFHDAVPFQYIAAVFGVMAATSMRHTYQILTKRPERARDFFAWVESESEAKLDECHEFAEANHHRISPDPRTAAVCHEAYERGIVPPELDSVTRAYDPWPLSNVWIGASCEDQERYDGRIDALIDCPAAVRFLSCEPLLGPIDLGLMRNRPSQRALRWHMPVRNELEWVIVGGESGPGARPMCVQWAESLVQQCADADVSCFVKQLGARPVVYAEIAGAYAQAPGISHKKGSDPSEWPASLNVREWPS